MVSQGAVVGATTQTTLLEFAIGTARAQILASKFFEKLFITVNNAETFLNPRLRWETFATLAGDFLERDLRGNFLRFS